MDITKAFRAKQGISFDDAIMIGYSANSPNLGGGESAPVGSVLIRADGGIPRIFGKYDVDDTAWIEISSAFVETTSAPTATTDASAGFNVFDHILNSTTNALYICVDNTEGSAVWLQVGSGGSGLPSGGTAGQIIVKQSATDGDVSWTTVYAVPSGGTANQVLKKNSATNGDYSWADESAGGGATDKASSTKQYYRYYETASDLASWQNTECKLNDFSGEPTWYNSGYQVSWTNYKGALICPHDVNKISVSVVVGRVKNKTGSVIPAGSTCEFNVHIALMSKNGVTNPHTIVVDLPIDQPLNGNQTTQRSSPLEGQASLSLPETISAGAFLGASVTFVDGGTYQIQDDLIIGINFEE